MLKVNKVNIMTTKCKFRFHRGSLKESLETTTEVSSKQELCKIVNQEYGLRLTPDNIKIRYYTEEQRIDWSTYIVTANSFGVLGFTNADLL